MKLSFLHFMAIIATVVESKPLVPTILGAPDDDETAAHAALAAAFYADAANFLEANAADQHDQDASTEGRMLDRRRRKKNKDDDDDDAEKRMGFGGKRLKMYCEEKVRRLDLACKYHVQCSHTKFHASAFIPHLSPSCIPLIAVHKHDLYIRL